MGGKSTCCAAEGVASNHDDRSMASQDAEASSEELPVDNPMQGRHNAIDFDFDPGYSETTGAREGWSSQYDPPTRNSLRNTQVDNENSIPTTFTSGSASASCPSFATGTYPYATPDAQRNLELSWSLQSRPSGNNTSVEEGQQPAQHLSLPTETDETGSMVPDGLTAMQPSETEEGSVIPPMAIARRHYDTPPPENDPHDSISISQFAPPPGSSLRSTGGVNDSSRSMLSSTSKAELERLHAELDSVTKYTPDTIACEEPEDPQWWGPYLEQVRAEEAAREAAQ